MRLVLGLLLGASAVIRFGITLLSGYASDRYGRKAVLVPGILLLVTATVGFTMVNDLTGFVICLAILSLGGFGNSIPTTMVVDAVPARQGWARHQRQPVRGRRGVARGAGGAGMDRGQRRFPGRRGCNGCPAAHDASGNPGARTGQRRGVVRRDGKEGGRDGRNSHMRGCNSSRNSFPSFPCARSL